MIPNKWLLDSSVMLQSLMGVSPDATRWINRMRDEGRLVGSKLLETEIARVLLTKRLQGEQVPIVDVSEYMRGISLGSLDDNLADEAAAIPQSLRTADAIHIATALRLGIDQVGIATHDAQMARAALALGFQVVDPVTDDPRHAQVVVSRETIA